MTDMPKTQNNDIVSTLMKAYEQRELKKLQHFSVENGKMLKKFERISKGKELSVGHHKVRQETSSSKAKTLNVSRNQ